ncbi:hypothetical protein KEJ13_08590 [Candidatus Bathyarchaeota archaeon]|nr:hypothetical protein [Candidatus Bathyarchaeota archaeon]
MPVRVRVKIKSLMGLNPVASIETCSLLNTGYTGASPEVILPAKLAEKLGFWPPPNESVESTYDTAGGLARFYAHFVIGEMGIIILNAYKGFWRFESDPPERVRHGKRPEFW